MVLLRHVDDDVLRLVHELRVAQGSRARGEPARRAALVLRAARAPGAHRGRRRADGRRRESDAYFALAPARPPDRRARERTRAARSRVATQLEERRARRRGRASTGATSPRPTHWGGFRLTPDAFEFWQHREDRLHDRVVYAARRATPGARASTRPEALALGASRGALARSANGPRTSDRGDRRRDARRSGRRCAARRTVRIESAERRSRANLGAGDDARRPRRRSGRAGARGCAR